MSRAQPQQARGFEFYNPQQQGQAPPRQSQAQSNIQPALSFQTTAPTMAASPCNQYVANPRLPIGVTSIMPGQTAAQGGFYSESSQFTDNMRRPPANSSSIPCDIDSMRRELEKSRGQISQLEKTLKWWSDCTANWREKWSKEKAERKKLKDELTQVRSTFDQSLSRELEKFKREVEENGGSEGAFAAAKRAACSTAVGTGDTLHRNLGNLNSMERSTVSIGAAIPTESTANFELQELLAETSSALEHEKTENAELKSEIDRLTAEQSTLKTELSLLKETIATLGGSTGDSGKVENGTASAISRHGLPSSVNELIDSLQTKIEQLEKDVASRQLERLNDWSVIDKLESERAQLRSENERLTIRIEDLEKALHASSADAGDMAENFKGKEIDSLRAEVHCLRRLVNRQTQELDHVNFLMANQETETKLLRTRLLQPWGASQRAILNANGVNGSAQTKISDS